MTVIRDERMQARREYTLALKEARRKHQQICDELGIKGTEVEDTFRAWLDGFEFDVQSDGKGGSILCMTRGRLPEGGFANPESEGITPIGACCENERRNMSGGCDNCGDPCL